MHYLSASLLLAAAATLAGAAPQGVTGPPIGKTESFTASYYPVNTFENLQLQQQRLKECDPNAEFPVVNGTSDDSGYQIGKTRCFVAKVSEKCYNMGIFRADVIYPDGSERQGHCVEWSPNSP